MRSDLTFDHNSHFLLYEYFYRSFISKVLQGHNRCDKLIKDFCDGFIYKGHPLFSIESTAFQIFVYYDDVELCNPLGSKAKIHKLGIV